MKEIKLQDKDWGLIVTALNHLWNTAHKNLFESKEPLGDLERKIYEKQLKETKRLMAEIEN